MLAVANDDGKVPGSGVLGLVKELRPEWERPKHLAGWCAQIERAILGGVRSMCSIPIQHYKTSTTLIGVAWLLRLRPKLRIIFLTYSYDRAQAVAKELREICIAAGVGPRSGFNKIDEWQNKDGGGVVVMSAEQSRLGYPCDILLVDDPVDEEAAYDRERRDRVDEKISHYTARAAIHNGSVLIVASRWHPDDPIGRRLVRKVVKWEYEHEPGIIDYGLTTERAFAEEVLTLEAHKKLQAEWFEVDPSGRKWWAQIQNDPKPDATGLFRQPAMFETMPGHGWRTAIGVDLAYSVAKGADYFAIVVLRFYGNAAYILESYRAHRDVEQATVELKKRQVEHPGAQFFSYASGPETGVLHFLIERGIPIQAIPARYDKQTRAQRTIAAWNAGRILVKASAPWQAAFIARCELFTGSDKAGDDDEIDALVSAYDGGMFSAVAVPTTLGKSRI
jgi:predicted phage terminase large subunit-like protein